MPRKKLIRTDQYFYHIHTRSNQKTWFSIPLIDVWQIAKKSLNHAYLKYPADIAQFVLMNNHYHLLIRTPDKNIDLFMYEFNKNFSLQLRLRTGLINKMFGGRYKWSLVTTNKYLINVSKYIYQNPIRAGVCLKCEDYRYSTLYYKNSKKLFIVPLVSSNEFDDDLCFLNDIYEKETENLIRKGLTKTTFKLVKKRKY